MDCSSGDNKACSVWVNPVCDKGVLATCIIPVLIGGVTGIIDAVGSNTLLLPITVPSGFTMSSNNILTSGVSCSMIASLGGGVGLSSCTIKILPPSLAKITAAALLVLDSVLKAIRSFNESGFNNALAIILFEAAVNILLPAVNNLPASVNWPNLALIISVKALPTTPCCAEAADLLDICNALFKISKFLTYSSPNISFKAAL